MTPDQINRAIAEACGGTYSANGPDFAGSLDAMASAREALTPEQKRAYGNTILRLVEDGPNNAPGFDGLWYDCANATPMQHAEAFLRAKGLWRATP